MQDKCKGKLFRDVVAALERAEHRLCVLHGYGDYPEYIRSDVDAVSEDPGRIPRIISERGVATVVQVFQHEATSYILHRRCNNANIFLNLDVATNCSHEGHVFFSGRELLNTCRPFKFFKVPSLGREFVCYLVRKAARGSLSDVEAGQLGKLYVEDPVECAKQVYRFFPEAEADLVLGAARSGDWEPVRGRLGELYGAVLGKKKREHPLQALRHRFNVSRRQARRVLRPPGLMVAFLGVDGAGKSTVMARIEQSLAPISWWVKRYHRRPLASALRWAERRRPQARSGEHESGDVRIHEPHAKQPRGLVASLAKLGFWWVDYALLGYAIDVRPRLVRYTLVMFDRHYHDLLVDPKRYRYGGPLWLARMVDRIVPKPHLIVLLDAPPEVIQARKQEVSFEETARQREAYLKLIESLPNGHVVDASKSLDSVVTEVEDIVLNYMAERVSRELEL